MSTPTFINSFSTTSFFTTGSSKSVSVTTQAGDQVVVYAGGANEIVNLSGISGNGISFTLRQSDTTTGFTSVYVWTGLDTSGGTNWTLSCSCSTSSQEWGMECLVLRNSGGIGTSGKAQGSGTPSLNVTTTGVNSALVVFNGDWNGGDGSSRVWRTMNGITPIGGNGETTYVFNPGDWTGYGAYYSDTGSSGPKTVGLSSPSGQKYNMVAVEVLGLAGTQSLPVAWLTI